MGVARFVDSEVLILDVLRIMMPNRAFASCICFAAGMVISGFFNPAVVILGSLMIICTYCSQAVFNNLIDREGDLINAPDRPLVSGSLTVEFARGPYATISGASWKHITAAATGRGRQLRCNRAFKRMRI